MRRMRRPALAGVAMGAMLLWLLHRVSVSGADGFGLAIFVGLHLLAIVLLTIVLRYGLHLHPRLSDLADRLHRPSLGHLTIMALSAVVSASVLHLFIANTGLL